MSWKVWSPQQVADRHKIVDKMLHDDPSIRDIHRLYVLLDQKSAALFGHVSIMIASCTFLSSIYTLKEQPLSHLIFLISTLLYLLIALRLLPVINFNMYGFSSDILPDPNGLFTEGVADNIYDEVNDAKYRDARAYFARAAWKRGKAHKSALFWTQVLTVAVIAGLGLDVLVAAWSQFPQAVQQGLRLQLEAWHFDWLVGLWGGKFL